MKPYFVIILALVVYSTNVQAYTPFYITNPVQGTILTAGTNATVTWLNGTSDIATIYLLEGEKADAMQLTGLSFDIEGKKGSYVWKVPAQILLNNTYTLMVSYPASSTMNETSYSSQFKIAQQTSPSISNASLALAKTAPISTPTSITSTSTENATTVTSTNQHTSRLISTSASLATSQLASTTPVPYSNSSPIRIWPNHFFIFVLATAFCFL